MRTLTSRAAIGAVLTITAAAVVVTVSGGSHVAARRAQVTSFEIQTPPELKALRGTSAPLAPVSVPNQGETLLTEEGFDDEAFPPDGWQVLVNSDVSEDVTWSRETCETSPSPPDNTASAWGVGGGATGEQLACGSNYTDPVLTLLAYGPVSGVDFDGGFRIVFDTNFLVPQLEDFPFGVCVDYGADLSPCRIPTDLSSEGWIEDFNSGAITEPANAEEVFVFFLYRDVEPTGDHFGAFVDNVRILGVGEARPTPTPPGGPRLPEIQVPNVWNRAGVDVLPAVDSVPPGTAVDFGTAWDAERNILYNAGEVFQHGHMSLCVRVRWWDQPEGTELHWQWYQNGNAVAPEDEGLNPTINVADEIGAAANCVQASQGGRNIPIPEGTYMVRAFLAGDPFADSEGEVVIQADAPPGATEVPPPPPTQTPLPTIAPTATPPDPGSGPRESLVNGDFERGPSVAWTWVDQPHVPDRTINDVITTEIADGVPIPRTSGSFAAVMGQTTGGDYLDQLSQPSTLTGLPEPGEIVSATMSVNVRLETDEVPDGTDDDLLLFAFASLTDPDEDEVVVGALSEEIVEATGEYRRYVADVTEEMTAREGWQDSLFILQGQYDGTDVTAWLIDDVSILITRTMQSSVRAPADLSARPAAYVPPGGRLSLGAGLAPVLRAVGAEGVFRGRVAPIRATGAIDAATPRLRPQGPSVQLFSPGPIR